MNEIGIAAGKGREVVPREDVNQLLTELAGEALHLPDGAVMTRGAITCPACGAGKPMWGCDPDQTRVRDEIHPLVWQ